VDWVGESSYLFASTEPSVITQWASTFRKGGKGNSFLDNWTNDTVISDRAKAMAAEFLEHGHFVKKLSF
jgi:hypothetical protein